MKTRRRTRCDFPGEQQLPEDRARRLATLWGYRPGQAITVTAASCPAGCWHLTSQPTPTEARIDGPVGTHSSFIGAHRSGFRKRGKR